MNVWIMGSPPNLTGPIPNSGKRACSPVPASRYLDSQIVGTGSGPPGISASHGRKSKALRNSDQRVAHFIFGESSSQGIGFSIDFPRVGSSNAAVSGEYG
eukprot:CAMPEP_0172827516 /NCGR_PEP_ID=MMETSP1075-20121228/20166_1 /TAXON_ID=2916 /ORGANISM="Ceratium fusus, Strain PA161109" /LENGTH=99 /DNA_ID=CAMNT_0013669339 /DNA_START=91 /DNA_END=390 /DNA_ORIENTATION=+